MWHDRENTAVLGSTRELDIDVLATSYEATMDLSYVVDMAVVLLIGLKPRHVVQLFNSMTSIIYRHNLRFVTAFTDTSPALLERLPSPIDPLRIPCEPNLVMVQSGTEHLAAGFEIQDTHEQERTVFVLSAAVVASGLTGGLALEGLLHLFRNQRAVFQRIRWDILQHGE